MNRRAWLFGIIAVTLSGALGGIILFVVPIFARTYSTLTAPDGRPLKLPLATESVIGLSDWMLDTGWFEFRFPGFVVLAIGMLLFVASALATGETLGGRRFFRGIARQSPVPTPLVEPSDGGVKTSDLDTGSVRSSDDDEVVRDNLSDLVSIVALALIVVTSVAIPAIAFAIYLPMLEIAESIR